MARKIEIIVERTKTGFSAYAANFDKYPAGTTGKTLQELKEKMAEALNLLLSYQGKPEIGEEDLKLTLDLPQFFAFYKVINAKALSERLGMHQSLLAQYINGTKKPSPAQTRRILSGVQQIGRELASVNFFI
jgi:hypothetical protein